MKLRELESALQDVLPFEAPKVELEQYPTSAHLASHLVHAMDSKFDELQTQCVCDLGCGSGMLSIAAALGGAAEVIGIDMDGEALQIASRNSENYEFSGSLDFLQMDLAVNSQWARTSAFKFFDVVVMNPPFGTKRRGIDMLFLVTAINLARKSVYSMHKTSTRDFISRKCGKWGVECSVIAEMSFDIGNMYSFHKKKSVDVEVDLWRFDVSDTGEVSFDEVFVSVEKPLKLNYNHHQKGKGRKR